MISEERARSGHAAEQTRSVVNIEVNAERYELAVPNRRTLLDFLRDDLNLTGTKKVCDMGHCGACTILKDGVATLSCINLAVAADGAQITTIEGLAGITDELTPIQKAFIEHDGFQCGFCTAGQIMSATALLRNNPSPTADEVRQYMAGNLCRCGAYKGIMEAVLSAAEIAQDGDN